MKAQEADSNCVFIQIAAVLFQFSRDILEGFFPDRRFGGTYRTYPTEQAWAERADNRIYCNSERFILQTMRSLCPSNDPHHSIMLISRAASE